MKTKEIRTGNGLFHLTLCQEDKKRWLEVPACKLMDDCDIEDFDKLLAKCLDFLDGCEEMEEVKEII